MKPGWIRAQVALTSDRAGGHRGGGQPPVSFFFPGVNHEGGSEGDIYEATCLIVYFSEC